MGKPTPSDLAQALSGIYKDPVGEPPSLDLAASDWNGWLRALQHSLWETTRRPHSRNPYELRVTRETRRLTPEEWSTLQDVLRTHQGEVICELHNACMGFGCGLAVFEEPPRIYPGADLKPEFLLDVTKDHLPLTVCDLREKGEHGSDCRDLTFFKDGWRAFSPFSHNDINTKRLKENGFGPPKSESHYDY